MHACRKKSFVSQIEVSQVSQKTGKTIVIRRGITVHKCVKVRIKSDVDKRF